ncbi:hypothetical protein ACHHYP_13381 [Achlya hypogyna]|uniref:Uncharacterized protein n=1 Tax=Achlya hypogyna TaxID=1202772 RepID=A0A1V9YFE6_ACHHY|nr:hypothetical protein ACHHYP_13381 [Achlya hypogyna]
MTQLPTNSYLISTKPPKTLIKLLSAAKTESIVLSTSLFYASSSAKLYGESMRKALTGLVIDIAAAKSFYVSDVGLKLYQHATYSSYLAKAATPLTRAEWERSVLFHPTRPNVASLTDVYTDMLQNPTNCHEIGAVVEWKLLRGVFYTYDATEEPDEMADVQRQGRDAARRFRLPFFRLERSSYSGPWSLVVESSPSRACYVQ